MPLFDGLTPAQMARLAPLFKRVTFAAGHAIFAQGDRAETVFVLEHGDVEIRFRPDDGDWLPIATARPGGVVGWSAALARPRYTSSAVCVTPVQAVAIRGDEFRGVVRSDADLGVLLLGRMALTIANRLAGAQLQIARLIHEEVGYADVRNSS
ncbi:MAG: cyclic nucleotide-binding domain-containing protein [Chloroflexi bacterium]|nr:cyclic nucleotide-binding domain-containing protein [Chloroflexota bacterium]